MIKNIIFDIGMVLVDFRYRALCKELGMDEETVEAVAKAMPENPDWNNLDLGIIPQEEIILNFKKNNPHISKEIDVFWDNISDVVRSFPQSKEWLSELKARGYRIYLLTNYPEEMFSIHCKTQFDFLGSVDGMVVSSHVKLTKPDARIFELLMSKYNLIPQECVFLDDRIANTQSAKALGIEAITVTDPVAARKKLDELLNTNECEA